MVKLVLEAMGASVEEVRVRNEPVLLVGYHRKNVMLYVSPPGFQCDASRAWEATWLGQICGVSGEVEALSTLHAICPSERSDKLRAAIVEFVKAYNQEHESSPSYATIASHVGLLGLSASHLVGYHVAVLVAQGRLRRVGVTEKGHSRQRLEVVETQTSQ
jgi:hypothetical protein